MNEDFVTYELAVKLKEKGFREECFATYDIEDGEFDFNNYILRVAYQMNITAKDCLRVFNDSNSGIIDAPTIPQVLKWLREEKKIFVVIAVNPTFSTKDKIAYYYQVYSNSNGVTSDYYESEECYAQWEDCAIESIKSVLKYLI